MDQQAVTNHFNKIAKDYDFYKKRNLLGYYSVLKYKIGSIIPPNSTILDYGCGTGEILNFLSPKTGVGYDPSNEMIKIASEKFRGKKNMKFVNSTAKIKPNFDYIILADVIEHLTNINFEFKKIGKLMNTRTKLVVTFVDSSWEWFPRILEIFNLKMPEGPHRRISYAEVIKIGEKSGLQVVKKSLPFSPIKIIVFTKKN